MNWRRDPRQFSLTCGRAADERRGHARVSGRRMTALSNCNIFPAVADIRSEKLKRVLRLGAYPHITVLSRPHESTLTCKKSAPLPSPTSNGHWRNSPGNFGKLLLFQHSRSTILGMTDHSLKQAGQDQVLGQGNALL